MMFKESLENDMFLGLPVGRSLACLGDGPWLAWGTVLGLPDLVCFTNCQKVQGDYFKSDTKLSSALRLSHLAFRYLCLWCGFPARPHLAARRAAATPRCRQASSEALHLRRYAPAVTAWPRRLAWRVASAAKFVNISSAVCPRRPHVSTAKTETERPLAGG